MSKKTESPVTYADHAAKLNGKARKALLISIKRDWEAGQKAVQSAARLEITAINRLRLVGLKLQEASGHEQIGFDFFHFIEPELPTKLHFGAAKFCIHLARKLEKPIKTLDEARSVRQMIFEAFGEASAPKRLTVQVAHEKNPWNDFISTASRFTSLFSVLEEQPMSEWSRDKLSTFINTTKPIAQKHMEAVRLIWVARE